MLGVLVNVGTVLIGSLVGLFLKRGIPEKVTEALMIGIGLCTVFIGISGALEGENTLVLILSMAIGTVIGTLLDIDKQLNRLAAYVEARFKQKEGQVTVAEGFVTASLLFCVGAMTIVGSLQAGLTGDCEMLFTKATLDLVSSCVLAASLGIGVLLADIFVLVFQGGIVLLAGLVAPFLTDYAIGEMTCAGSVLIIALGLNLIGVTKIKVANYLPVIFIPPILCLFMS
ncbi:DUF554 domain-containing protein [Frisingicoccus sp.]|uniref:DUF554 domain-containing protein n=1 Tax=Frisingicoccus sp. TaxID=1918627 RepID=UPI003AB4C07C